jgi:hypothetical protein
MHKKIGGNMKNRQLEIGYIQGATLIDFNPNTTYKIISAKDASIQANKLLSDGSDIVLFRLHMHDADERRLYLGLVEDDQYEIMVTFSPKYLNETSQNGNVKFSKLCEIPKGGQQPGFSANRMFTNLKFKKTLQFDIELTEVDNDKVDPDPLAAFLDKTAIKGGLDLAIPGAGEYLRLATSISDAIQTSFGRDKAGDDRLWNDTLSLESSPTVPGQYRLREGIYVIVEYWGPFMDWSKITYWNNVITDISDPNNHRQLLANHLVFGIGLS